MQALLARRANRHQYLLLLRNLLALYEALEERLAGEEHGAVSAWRPLMAQLERAPALRADLLVLAGPLAQDLPLDPAAANYRARLASLHGPAAHRLAAHVYVRYLGDLHGGQILRSLVRELFELPGDEGTRFFDFGDALAVQRARADVRATLASLPLTPAQSDEVVDEAVWSFAAHCELFEGIASPPESGEEAADLGVQGGGAPR